MQLQFVGCGDAFGSGGRFNTCFHVTGDGANFLVDCGASSMIAMKRLGIDPNAIETILITDFHGDHFGGIPYLMLDAQFLSKRTAPLTIAGPPGLSTWYPRVMETTFPASMTVAPKFDLQLVELEPEEQRTIGPLTVTAFPVNHGAGGAGQFYAYRIAVSGRILAYTGDSEWTDTLIDAGRGADLYVCEAYFRDKAVRLHLTVAAIEAHLDAINPKRLVLTHMSDDVLAHLGEIAHQVAEDGMVVEF